MTTAVTNNDHGIGRRKRAVAQVKLVRGTTGAIHVNGRDVKAYFPQLAYQAMITAPLRQTGMEGQVEVAVKTSGGGVAGQAGAIRLGIARALIAWNPDFRPVLKKEGMLTRDARRKERKKYGLKKARRAPQWAKR
ncbi:30S ribosomal protein S9 [Candidatus Uhrbacteria bacterium]|nr:30S ribosomal protein S9 [Candidatus Uhrbacteria bacterium]